VASAQLSRRVPAHYSSSLVDFVVDRPEAILGILTTATGGILEATQRDAWIEEIDILKRAVSDLEGTIYLEFDIPRLGSRVDAIVVSGAAVIPIEFKCGDRSFSSQGYNQAWDYGLDLKNFHEASHDASILPILVATKAPSGDPAWSIQGDDGVWAPRRSDARGLAETIREATQLASGQSIDAIAWGVAPYRPTPTIIEAARALYSRHSVDAITRNDAEAQNLSVTSGAIEEVIDRARTDRSKAIVFVTGVPGAGKTLVGLDIATRRRELGDARAVFLSGNGPLVAVLQEALTRDEMRRRGTTMRKGQVRQMVKPFIQNVHHFRDEGVRNPNAPFDHVVIFDEAQRAWDRHKTANFMKRRKGIADFSQSESEFLISYLDRHSDWAVIVCLVGGGQEIHTGEAGISEWLAAVRDSHPHWQAFISPELADSEYAASSSLTDLGDHLRGDHRLHLASSMRSFRAGRVSAFVKALLDCDVDGARASLRTILDRYPIVASRSLDSAKHWLRRQARGSESIGLVASSQAQRLKPHAIDVRVEVDPINWFLGERTDTRSSFFLEDAATEFQIQGLELDWICVNWDADLRLGGSHWQYHSFRGDRWTTVHKVTRRRYLLNAYRVLLTRARQGMAIFVPPGDHADPTRNPDFYDETFTYLVSLGVPEI